LLRTTVAPVIALPLGSVTVPWREVEEIWAKTLLVNSPATSRHTLAYVRKHLILNLLASAHDTIELRFRGHFAVLNVKKAARQLYDTFMKTDLTSGQGNAPLLIANYG
jgi:hypothetical protein